MKVDKFKRGQIWWLQENKIYDGNVQSGNRPVIIISNDANNRHSNNLTVVPCTSQDKKDLPTHFTFTINEESIALAECIRTINKEKIGTYIGTMSLLYQEKALTSIDLYLNETMEFSLVRYLWFYKEKILILMIVFVLFFLLLYLVKRKKIKKLSN